MPKPAKEDAFIHLELMEQFPSESLNWFNSHFSAKDFKEFMKKNPRESAGYLYFNKFLTFFEMAGVLMIHKLLNEDVF